MTRTFSTVSTDERHRGLTMAASVLRRGALVVLPVESSYAVAAAAFDQAAVGRLLAAKGRPRSTPVPVMVPSIATLDGVLHHVTPELRSLVTALWPGPLTIVARHAPSLTWDLGQTHGVVSIRMPLHPVALDLLRAAGPLAVMAANAPGQDPPATAQEALAQLTGSIEVALDAGPRPPGAPSAIVDLTVEPPALRRVGEVDREQLTALLPELVEPS